MGTQASRHRRKARKSARQRKRRQKSEARSRARTSPAARRETLARQLEEAASWPVLETRISEDWREEHGLAQILVARHAPDGRVAAALFLVDLGCLGAKNGFARIFPNGAAYEALRERADTNMPMEACDPAQAAKVVREGIRYARDLGFQPHPDAAAGLPLLGGPAPCEVEIPVGGRDGRPFYVQGPHDDTREILDRLDEQVGSNGYGFILGGDPLGLGPQDDADEFAHAWVAEEVEDGRPAHLLAAFAQPMLAGSTEAIARKAVEAKVRLAGAIWNAVVIDQLNGTSASFRDLRERLLAAADTDQGPLRVLLETMRTYKLRKFPEDLIGFDEIGVVPEENGAFRVGVRAVHLSGPEGGLA